MLEVISGQLRIAVIDDVEIQAQFVQALVKSCASDETEVDYFTNPNIALEAICTGRYYAVFTDVHMEEMKGDDVVRQINALNLGVQTFVLTGDDGFILALNCFRLGCRNIFVKPPKTALIREAVEKVESDFFSWRKTFADLNQRKKSKLDKKAS
ncbi:response regulator [Pseudobacteriovorax antillogorgiicola]|uniref:Response regulator receiver domain-containing protein n=1 Tax=Pseudobacteriovorax antillogorgiicola TaxID=1513793 RepID=A0A1Y6BKR9_9BACT|nr:response regulator [Pseudobacteriovorax antillogorgiicola]TCS54697.1 response regulator receiver domain-containing protein [Pseudobacteriovorax antillogorgiicola]SMF16374.1 Response regulator receiver domain-containing protein [Pseudobacteriovorax antillogorgiicola]